MTKHTDQRDRTLLLAQILFEETDERHPLSLRELTEKLNQGGVSGERKSIYRDMGALRKRGVDVAFRAGNNGGWYLASRTFTPEELRSLADAVAVYRWIDEDLRETLTKKLTGLASRYQRKSLLRRSVSRRKAVGTEEMAVNLHRVHQALESGRALTVTPFTYRLDGTRNTDEGRRVVSPKGLLWAEEGYRLLAWEHQTGEIKLYRLDRLTDLRVTGLPAQGPAAEPDQWLSMAAGSGAARRERILLHCDNELAGEIFDQFGSDTKLTPDGDGFAATVDAAIGPAFWGWLTAQGGKAEVTAPAWVARAWKERYRAGVIDLPVRGRNAAG